MGPKFWGKTHQSTTKVTLTSHQQEGIKLRDCYFGGRTNGLVLHKVFENGEKGYYLDFTSLYPAVLKYKKYPVGHPTRIIDNFKNVSYEKCKGNCPYTNCKGTHLTLPYFGAMKATFLPPTNLLHPVLPIRCNKDKLKFPLCYNSSCGPKNYTYKLNSGEVACKVRGFSLNYRASQVINFESMKEALYSWKKKDKKELVTVRTEILRDKKSPKVYNKVVHKHYGVVYDKRIVLDNFTTVPYGYRF